jgi:hypothetical protein
MKKIFFSLLIGGLLFLTGCLESTQEITLNDNGSGTVSNTNDMSALIGLVKQMGAGKELEKAGEQKIDSSFSLAAGADSIPNLTQEEKELIKKGTANIVMNLKEEKFITSIKFPFSSMSEIQSCNKLSGKVLAETMKSQMGNGMPMGGGDEMPEATSIDDYYSYEFSNGELKKKLNKEKYAGAADDEFLKGMKEAGGMGLEMKSTYIINLPRAAKETEGKGIKLSDDKKKITISVSLDDFFEDPSLLEYKIKY